VSVQNIGYNFSYTVAANQHALNGLLSVAHAITVVQSMATELNYTILAVFHCRVPAASVGTLRVVDVIAGGRDGAGIGTGTGAGAVAGTCIFPDFCEG